MITLEDIPEAIAKDFDWTPRSQIAAILNAAIEAGLVVPASEGNVMRRALALLRTIRSEGYTPGGAGSIAIEQRIKELESEGSDDQA